MNNAGERGSLITISAASGTGKTSLVEALIERNNRLVASVSHTTRPIRRGEKDGIDYHFVSPKEFQRMLDSEQFLEYATVYDYLYGTSCSYVEESLANGLDVILEIDWQGARQVRRRSPDCVSIFVLPPSRDALCERLRTRAQDEASVIARRMEKAVSEMSHFSEADFVVINDEFAQTVEQLENIIRSSQFRTSIQRVRLSSLLESLLAE